MKNQKFAENQGGALNVLLIPLILAVLFFFAAAGFGYWAFTTRQTFKDHADTLVAAGETEAKAQQADADKTTYNELEKKPFRTYIGPSAYGSLNVVYPKTWSAYVAVSPQAGGSTPLDGYFNPATVPNAQDPTSVFALRVQVVQLSYDQVLSAFQSAVQNKQLSVTPYSLPKVPSIVGVRMDGQIKQNIQGSIIVLPMRDKTLKIWTEAAADEADFNNNILPNLSFSP